MILADSLLHIAAAAIPTTGPGGASESSDTLSWIILIAGSLPGAALAAAGAWRPARVIGPSRTEHFQSRMQFAAIFFFGLFAYLLTSISYNSRVHQHAPGPVIFTEVDYAFLATVPQLVGFFVLLTCDNAFAGRAGMRALGVDPLQIPRGVLFGIIGAIIAIPLVMWAEILTQSIYQRFQYTHPMQHELLPAMTEGPRWARTAVMLGALIIAPLFEETLFRGHLQTLLRSALIRLWARLGKSPSAPPSARPGTWLAIILTSVAFAAVHDPWMMPPIFVLSLCLGYAYERTGLLWTTIAMHMLFNGVETCLYFLQQR